MTKSGKEILVRLIGSALVLCLLLAIVSLVSSYYEPTEPSLSAQSSSSGLDVLSESELGSEVSHGVSAQASQGLSDDTTRWRPQAETSWLSDSAFLLQLRKTGLALILITLLAWGCLKLAQNYLPSLRKTASPNSWIQILDSQQVDGAHVVLAEVMGQYFLFSKGADGLQPLAELSQETCQKIAKEQKAREKDKQASQNSQSLHSSVWRQYLSIIPGVNRESS